MKSKENFTKCLSCPIAHKFISEYFNYYNLLRDTRKRDKAGRELLEQSIRTLAKIMHIEGKVYEAHDLFCTLSSENMNMSIVPVEITDCIANLNYIISHLEILFYKDEYGYESILDFKKGNIKILSTINDLLANDKIQTLNLTDEEKKWSKKYLETLGMTSSEDEYEDDPEKEQIEKAKDTYEKFRTILIAYCQSVDKIEYKYCNPIFGEEKSLCDCRTGIKSNDLYINRLFLLNNDYRDIALNYLENAPKKFKDTLKLAMKKQGLGYTEVSELWANDKKHASSIQKLLEEDKNKLDTHDKEILQRILLVSYDVLKYGKGKIYGNWKLALDEKKNEEFYAKLSEDKELFNIAKEHRAPKVKKYAKSSRKIETEYSPENDKKGMTQELIRGRIRDLIAQNADDFYSMIKKHPDFFCEDDICLYAYEENGEIYYDYQAMYEHLRHPEEFDLLLSLLEE